ncbi:hypothetical protein V8E53_013405 [Lactarius tabidus]
MDSNNTETDAEDNLPQESDKDNGNMVSQEIEETSIQPISCILIHCTPTNNSASKPHSQPQPAQTLQQTPVADNTRPANLTDAPPPMPHPQVPPLTLQEPRGTDKTLPTLPNTLLPLPPPPMPFLSQTLQQLGAADNIQPALSDAPLPTSSPPSGPRAQPMIQVHKPTTPASEDNTQVAENPTPPKTSRGNTDPMPMPNTTSGGTAMAMQTIPPITIKPRPRPVLPGTNSQAQGVPINLSPAQPTTNTDDL